MLHLDTRGEFCQRMLPWAQRSTREPLSSRKQLDRERRQGREALFLTKRRDSMLSTCRTRWAVATFTLILFGLVIAFPLAAEQSKAAGAASSKKSASTQTNSGPRQDPAVIGSW